MSVHGFITISASPRLSPTDYSIGMSTSLGALACHQCDFRGAGALRPVWNGHAHGRTEDAKNCRKMPAQDAVYFGYGGELRSGFGKQVLAPQHTAPNVGFGSSGRAASHHIYASAEHDRAKVKSAGGNQSQGAIYQLPVSHDCQSPLQMQQIEVLVCSLQLFAGQSRQANSEQQSHSSIVWCWYRAAKEFSHQEWRPGARPV